MPISNENRARFLRDSQNTPRDFSVYDGVAVHRPPNDLPPPLRGDAPMTLDPHQSARHSNENRTVMPAEKSRAKYTGEIHRRLHSTSGDSYK